jgi:hypothetical protein
MRGVTPAPGFRASRRRPKRRGVAAQRQSQLSCTRKHDPPRGATAPYAALSPPPRAALTRATQWPSITARIPPASETTRINTRAAAFIKQKSPPTPAQITAPTRPRPRATVPAFARQTTRIRRSRPGAFLCVPSQSTSRAERFPQNRSNITAKSIEPATRLIRITNGRGDAPSRPTRKGGLQRAVIDIPHRPAPLAHREPSRVARAFAPPRPTL